MEADDRAVFGLAGGQRNVRDGLVWQQQPVEYARAAGIAWHLVFELVIGRVDADHAVSVEKFFEAVDDVARAAVQMDQERHAARGLHAGQVAGGDVLQGGAVDHHPRIPGKICRCSLPTSWPSPTPSCGMRSAWKTSDRRTMSS